LLGIELTCGVIVALYVALRMRERGENGEDAEDGRAAVLVRLMALACAAWVGEDSVIRVYGFYSYSPTWSAFLDRVPLLIVLIWPVVIDSAHLLARCLATGTARIAAASGLIVLADASLIEPIAVHARLWAWSPDNPRALFDVPLIGVLGWALFAAAAVAVREVVDARRAPGSARQKSCGTSAAASRLGSAEAELSCFLGAPPRTPKAAPAPLPSAASMVERQPGGTRRQAWNAMAVGIAPLATHAALVAAWWGLFRWFHGGWRPWVPAAVAWCVLAPVTAGAWRKGENVPLGVVMTRAPGAVFFFVLLGLTARDRLDLVAYALAFAPPYVALIAKRVLRAEGARTAASRPSARMPGRGMRTG
jgi:hypothetical protein